MQLSSVTRRAGVEHGANSNTEGLLTFKFAPTDDSMDLRLVIEDCQQHSSALTDRQRGLKCVAHAPSQHAKWIGVSRLVSRQNECTWWGPVMRGEARVAARGWGSSDSTRAFKAGPTAAASARLLTWFMHHKGTQAQVYNTHFCSMAVDMHTKMMPGFDIVQRQHVT
ncbi:MAG: hypothetical protein FRX49_01686 [Trebouxia sp. A1-2]|nr:MAG: hypothetical protein FRX49_01686 [Trebouxia sp. A1-2]